MKKILNKLQIIFLVSFICTALSAQQLTNQQIVDRHIPPVFFQGFYKNIVPKIPIDRDAIMAQFIEDDFNSKNGTRYLIAIYYSHDGEVDNPQQEFSVIKVSKDGSSVVLPRVKNYDSLGYSHFSHMEKYDLDGDDITDIVIENFDPQGQPTTAHILKWNGANLENISPLGKDGRSILDGLTISVQEGLPSLLFFDEYRPSGIPKVIGTTYRRILELTPKGFVDHGTFNFVQTIFKEDKEVQVSTFNNVKLPAGLYTLEVKNLSKHKRAVRAEISVNGVVVLKPEDFCSKKPKKYVKKKDKKGNDIIEDDDDDNDEDNCKRCDPRKSIYADVPILANNNIVVKLYGKKNSKIQVSLKKKN